MTSKKDLIQQRRTAILHYLSACADGTAGYDYDSIAEQLNTHDDYRVGQRTIRGDCKKLMEQGLVKSIKKGVVITEKGAAMLVGRVSLEEGIREKYLKQMAILKSLYACAAHSNPGYNNPGSAQGLSVRDLARLEGVGSQETVETILQQMAQEGLVQNNNGGYWTLGGCFSPPLPMDSQTAGLLNEYLNSVALLVPLPADLAVLKSKLTPLMVMPRRDQWRENMIKQNQRIIIHGREPGYPGDMHRVLAVVEEAIQQGWAVDCIYKGRSQLLYPLGVIYHWQKGRWYLMAQTNPINTRTATVTWPLNRFTHLQISSASFHKPDEFNLEQHLVKRWGISDDQELTVVIQFQNTPWHPTALEKLQAELSRRQTAHRHCQLAKQPDGSVILHDQIQGLSEFAHWLRGYGDAARVMEPQPLRRAMAQTGRKMLARYGVGVEADENE